MKGLAIAGVVAGHLRIDMLEMFVNYWHLPVFFFVSGYFLKQKHIDNSKEFIISRCRRLLVPFVAYALIALLLHNPLSELNIISEAKYGLSGLINGFKHLLLLSSNESLIGAMWFLPSLFIVSIFSIFAIKYSNHSKSAVCLWGGVVFAAIIFSYARVPSPYSIWQNISISWLFIAGYYCSRTKLDDKAAKWYCFVVSALLIAVLILSGMRFGLQASMINTQPILFPVAFIAGIVMINYLSHIMTNTNLGTIFGFIGNYSFSIMALHFVGFKLVTYVRTFVDDSVELSSFPVDTTDIHIYGLLYWVVGIAFPVLVAMTVGLSKKLFVSKIESKICM